MANSEDSDKNKGSIIVKLPLSRLKYLKNEFESDEDGLELENFLSAMVEHATFENVGEILQSVPAMIDFFRDVDINGDGQMDWMEFTQSIVGGIEREVVVHNEEFHTVAETVIQKSPAHFNATCSLVVPHLKRIFVGIMDEILLYGLNEQSPSLLTPLQKKVKLHRLTPQDRFDVLGDSSVGDVDSNMDDSVAPPAMLSFAYINSMSTLCVLRSDNSIEFFKIVVRSLSNNMSGETLEQVGVVQLGNPFTEIAVRDIAKQSIVLFAVGADRHIYHWEVSLNTQSRVVLSSPQCLSKHTDYVLDIVVVVNDSFKLFLSVGMDKKLRIWDLDTLHHKAYRTYAAGLQCLAFDGKSTVLAGAVDNAIIAWSLDSQMDIPLYKLIGHTDSVLKIIAMNDWCMSLDAKGTVHYWDIDIAHQIEDEDRLIDVMDPGAADKLSTFAVFQNVSSCYKGLVVVASGKQQYVNTIHDVTPMESSPMTVLFCADLLMIISIHTKNIVQWNVLTGKQIRSHSYAASVPNCELTCAVLADRDRKFIVGDSFGNVILYSCLTVQKLRQFANFPFAIKHLIFSEDKNVIVIGNPGYLQILDSSVNNVADNGLEYQLRDTVAHTNDVLYIAYSRMLGLIATADSEGVIKIWSYSSLIIESVIDCNDIMLNGDHNQMVFMDPYPLLLVPDVEGNFFVIAVGYAATRFGKRFWKLESRAVYPVTPLVAPSMSSSPVHGRSSGIGGRPGSPSKKTNEEKLSEKEAQLRIAAYHLKMDHLATKRGVSSIHISYEYNNQWLCFSGATTPLNEGEAALSPISHPDPTVKPLVDEPSSGDNDENQEDISSDDETGLDGEVDPLHVHGNQGVPVNLTGFLPDRRILVYCGHDDGKVSIYDITDAMAEVNVRALEEKEYVYSRSFYNAKRKLKRFVGEDLIARSKWQVADMSRIKINVYTKCILKKVWSAHEDNIVSLSFVGDRNYLLTASDDHCIQAWSKTGSTVGILTRGRALDSIVRSKWSSPIDIEARQERREREAIEFVSQLNLHPLSRKDYMEQQMAKWPRLFEQFFPKRTLTAAEDDSQLLQGIGAFSTVEDSKNVTTLNANSQELEPEVADRHSLLKQLVPDKTATSLAGSTKVDDKDLDIIDTERSGAGPKGASSKRANANEKRYYDSVTLDADALIASSGCITADASISGTVTLGESTTLGGTSKSMQKSSIMNEHEKRLELARMKREADLAGLSRQKSLYPHMSKERRRRVAMGQHTPSGTNKPFKVNIPAGLMEEQAYLEAQENSSRNNKSTCPVPTLRLGTGGATSKSTSQLPRGKESSLMSKSQMSTAALFASDTNSSAKSKKSLYGNPEETRSSNLLARIKENHMKESRRMSDETLSRRNKLISFDAKILTIEQSEIKLPPLEEGVNVNPNPMDRLLSHSKWSRKLSLYRKLD